MEMDLRVIAPLFKQGVLQAKRPPENSMGNARMGFHYHIYAYRCRRMLDVRCSDSLLKLRLVCESLPWATTLGSTSPTPSITNTVSEHSPTYMLPNLPSCRLLGCTKPRSQIGAHPKKETYIIAFPYMQGPQFRLGLILMVWWGCGTDGSFGMYGLRAASFSALVTELMYSIYSPTSLFLTVDLSIRVMVDRIVSRGCSKGSTGDSPLRLNPWASESSAEHTNLPGRNEAWLEDYCPVVLNTRHSLTYLFIHCSIN